MNFPPQGNDTSGAASIILPGTTGGPLYLTKNGAGAPPYSFAGDTDTGWDSDAANTISGYTSGTLRFTLNTASLTLTLPIVAPNGTNAACGVQLTAGAGYGMFIDSDGWLSFSKGGVAGLKMDSSAVWMRGDGQIGFVNGALPGSIDTGFSRSAAGVMQLNTGVAGAGASLEMFEQTAPAAPAANGCRLYCVDSGGGKTQLRAIFNTGASQLIAAEP